MDTNPSRLGWILTPAADTYVTMQFESSLCVKQNMWESLGPLQTSIIRVEMLSVVSPYSTVAELCGGGKTGAITTPPPPWTPLSLSLLPLLCSVMFIIRMFPNPFYTISPQIPRAAGKRAQQMYGSAHTTFPFWKGYCKRKITLPSGYPVQAAENHLWQFLLSLQTKVEK